MAKNVDSAHILLIFDSAGVVEMMELCQFGNKAAGHHVIHTGIQPTVQHLLLNRRIYKNYYISISVKKSTSEMLCTKVTLR